MLQIVASLMIIILDCDMFMVQAIDSLWWLLTAHHTLVCEAETFIRMVLSISSSRGAVRPENWLNFAQFVGKVAKNVKMSFKVNLKVQNIYTKPHLKP
jgi:hypothetical protein